MNTVRTSIKRQNVRKYRSYLWDIITEINNTLEGINSRLSDTE